MVSLSEKAEFRMFLGSRKSESAILGLRLFGFPRTLDSGLASFSPRDSGSFKFFFPILFITVLTITFRETFSRSGSWLFESSSSLFCYSIMGN